MGSLGKRVGALEEFIEGCVRERMRAEVEAMLDVLEENLTRGGVPKGCADSAREGRRWGLGTG